MKKIGIVGFGFMGNMHFNCYNDIDGVEVAAICDIDENKLKGEGAAGNLEGAEGAVDLTGIETYTDAEEMFAKANLDAVSITLPTYLHKDYTLKAIDAGLDVLCEKPMALSSDECKEMVDAADKAGKILQVGHCIRFWPDYAKAKEIIDSGSCGKVKSAVFRRLSMTPDWAWDGWILDDKRSGGSILDLHIHDSDFVQYLFGMPKSVSTSAIKGPGGGYDHTVTQFEYDDDKVVVAEGGWLFDKSFGFQMSFEIVLEKATICFDCTREPVFKICKGGEVETPELSQETGWLRELAHFAKAISGEKVSEIITPQQSLNSVVIIEAERKSADSREKVGI